MDKIKRFIDCSVPTSACNLKCHYCYVGQNELFGGKIEKLPYPIEFIVECLSIQRLGGICLFNLCACGETLLSEETIQLTRALINEGHYVMIITNGTISERFDEFVNWKQVEKDHLFIKFSFHYIELKRLGLLEKYVDNVLKMKVNHISYTVEMTATDEYASIIDEIKEFCIKRFGALCHISVGRDERTDEFKLLTKMSEGEYKSIWDEFDSELFSLKYSTYGVKRKEFCYAGEWSCFLDLLSGRLKKCVYEDPIFNIYDNKDQIYFEPVGCNCKSAYCWNAHAYLTLGTIPQLDTPTYEKMRNRVCTDSTEWLTEPIKRVFSSKLENNNFNYNDSQVKDLQYLLNSKYYLQKDYYQLQQEFASMKKWCDELTEAKEWLTDQVSYKDLRIKELEKWVEEQEKTIEALNEKLG